jgi:hypothetical protein
LHTSFKVVIDGIVLGGFYALMAQGLSLIFGIMRVHQPCARRVSGHRRATLPGWLTSISAVDLFVALPVLIAWDSDSAGPSRACSSSRC